MKVTYNNKGEEIAFRRIDRICTFHAIDCFRPENSSLVYFHTDRYNIVTIPAEDIIKIEEDQHNEQRTHIFHVVYRKA